MNEIAGRIWFAGNPWPGGHRIVSCELVASIHPAWGAYEDAAVYRGPALTLSIELKTADYDEGDDPSERDSVGENDWRSKIVWNNYGSCWIGESQSSATPGILISNTTEKFSFCRPSYRWKADPLPGDFDRFMATQAFGIYLLGHDAVCDHDIRLHSRQSDGSYTLDWTGKIALYYSGDTEFRHDFRAQVSGVRFEEIRLWYFHPERAKDDLGILVDPAMTPQEYIAPYVDDPGRFRFEQRRDSLGRVCTYAVLQNS